MVIFGENLNEVQDLKLCIGKLNKLSQEFKQNQTKYQYIQQLKIRLQIFQDILTKDRNEYIKIMKKNFNEYKQDSRKDSKFQVNNKVMYYQGDETSTLKKLRDRWTGPWIITETPRDNEVIIYHPKDRISKPVHVDRLKKFHASEWWTLEEYESNEK